MKERVVGGPAEREPENGENGCGKPVNMAPEPFGRAGEPVRLGRDAPVTARECDGTPRGCGRKAGQSKVVPRSG